MDLADQLVENENATIWALSQQRQTKGANMAIINASKFSGEIPARSRLHWALKVLVPDTDTRMKIILDAEGAAMIREHQKAKAEKKPFTRLLMTSPKLVNDRLGDGTFPSDTLAILDAGLVDALKRVKAKSIENFAASLDDFDKVPTELRFAHSRVTATENPKQAAPSLKKAA